MEGLGPKQPRSFLGLVEQCNIDLVSMMEWMWRRLQEGEVSRCQDMYWQELCPPGRGGRASFSRTPVEGASRSDMMTLPLIVKAVKSVAFESMLSATVCSAISGLAKA